MRIEWVECAKYVGSDGHTCGRCEGSGWREKIVASKGDCRTCKGFGKIADINRLVPCPENCGSDGYDDSY